VSRTRDGAHPGGRRRIRRTRGAIGDGGTGDLDSPVSATRTSQKAKTWTITIKADAQRKFGEFLQITVTTMYAWSRTTQVNVAVTAPVPPHSTVRGDYGVSAFNVTTFDHVVTWTRTHFQHIHVDNCAEGSGPVTRNVPTTLEGWQLTTTTTTT
jgi:hypothetical protein